MHRTARILLALLLTPALLLAGCSDRDLLTGVAPEDAPHPATTTGLSVCPGTVRLATQAQVDAFTCNQVTGDLLIAHNLGVNTDIRDLRPLSSLLAVGGTLQIYRNPNLASLAGLDNLVAVSGSLDIRENGALASVAALRRLTAIGGRFDLTFAPALTSLAGLENLESLGGILRIEGAALTSLAGLSGLTAVGDVYLYNNPSLASLAGMDNVATGGWVTIRDNDALTSLAGLKALASATRLDILENDALTSLDGLEKLASVSDYLLVERNPALASIAALATLSSSGGLASAGLTLSDSDALTSLTGLEALSSVGGQLAIHHNAALTSLEALGSLTTVGGNFSLSSNGALTALAGLDNLTSVGGLFISNNDALTSLAGIEHLTTVSGDLSITDNLVLASLAGPQRMTTVGGHLRISRNDVLTSLAGLESLTTTGVNLEVSQNPALASLAGLENVTSVGPTLPGDLIIRNNPALTSLEGLRRLATVGGYVHVEYNAALPSLEGLGQLTTVGRDFFIRGNAALTSLAGLTSFRVADRGLYILNNPVLASLTGLENLTVVSDQLQVMHNGGLTTLDGLQNLTRIGTGLRIESNPVLSTCACGLAGLISSGVFTGVGGTVTIANNAPGGACDSPSAVLASPCAGNRPPAADAGRDQIVECSSPAGASVALDGSGSTDPDGDPLSFAWSRNGSVFATGATPTATFSLGVHAVLLTVNDGKGGSATDGVQITVRDTRPPTLTLLGADPLVVAQGGSYVEPGATASDACHGDLTSAITIDASAVDPTTPGSYAVQYRVTDPAGNAAAATRTVEVTAAPGAPVITVGAQPLTVWPPNGKYHRVSLSQLQISVSDPTQPSLSAAQVVIAAVRSDEPEVGAGDNTRNDIVIAAGCRAVDLRAERREQGNGRVYTLELAVTNAAGATGRATYQVRVPVGRMDPAVDDGAAAGYGVAGVCGS